MRVEVVVEAECQNGHIEALPPQFLCSACGSVFIWQKKGMVEYAFGNLLG